MLICLGAFWHQERCLLMNLAATRFQGWKITNPETKQPLFSDNSCFVDRKFELVLILLIFQRTHF